MDEGVVNVMMWLCVCSVLQINDLLPVLKLLGGDASMQLSTQPECGEVLCGRFHGECPQLVLLTSFTLQF